MFLNTPNLGKNLKRMQEKQDGAVKLTLT